jgi:hypothetical protein
MILPEKLLPVLPSHPGICQNDTAGDMEMETDSLPEVREIPVTALLSERSLAREWLKPEEDEAWDYL